jgi:hypothetical protein
MAVRPVGLRDIEPAASRVPNGPIRDAAQRGFDRTRGPDSGPRPETAPIQVAASE